MAKKSMFNMDIVKEKTIGCLRELEQIELKRAARLKPGDEKRNNQFIKAGEISGLIKIYETL